MSKYIFNTIFLILLISCKSQADKINQQIESANNDTCPNYIDFDVEENFYVLDILDTYPDNLYYMDERGKCTLSVSNKVYVDNVYYCGFKDVHKAIKYAKDNNKNEVTRTIAISIKTKENTFKETFKYSHPISFEPSDSSYSIHEIKVELDDCMVYHKQEVHNALKVIFSEKDYGENFRFWIFNFMKEENEWKLVTKERISLNQKFNEKNNHKLYSIDSLDNCTYRENSLVILDQCLFSFY